MSRSALLAAASLLIAAALPAAVVGTAEAAKPKPKPKLTASAPTVLESAGKAVVTVRLSTKAKKSVKVSWRTADGTAKAGSDYGAGKGTVTIKKGKTSATIKVGVLGDTGHEGTEAFAVRLSSRQAKVPAKPVAVKITDDDPAGPPAPSVPPAPSAPSALAGTVTVVRTSAFPTGTTTLTLNLHLVPTATDGEWRDDGSGSWSITGNETGAPIPPCPANTTDISDSGVFLTGAEQPFLGEASLVLSDFNPAAATGTPSLSWDGAASQFTTTWIDLGFCTSVPIFGTRSFSLAAPGAAGGYAGTTGATRGVAFGYGPVGADGLTVTGTLTPVS